MVANAACSSLILWPGFQTSFPLFGDILRVITGLNEKCYLIISIPTPFYVIPPMPKILLVFNLFVSDLGCFQCYLILKGTVILYCYFFLTPSLAPEPRVPCSALILSCGFILSIWTFLSLSLSPKGYEAKTTATNTLQQNVVLETPALRANIVRSGINMKMFAC